MIKFRYGSKESIQLSFVALVWLLLFAVVVATQGCAPREEPKTQIIDPKDFVVDKSLTLTTSQYLVVNRLIFSRDGRIVTHGNDLRIEAKEVISDDGVIAPFSEEDFAAPGQAGKGGGRITITAKHGRGTLYVFGRGQNGGPGMAGIPGRAGNPGKEGRIALGTHEKVDVVCNCGSKAHAIKHRMKHGNLFDQIFAHQEFMAQRMFHRCISEPSDGQPGEQGGHGGRGGDGGSGGDSARIYFAAEDASSLQIKAYPIPGLGGAGGSGGRGGEGGRGGAPGNHNLDYFENCRAAAQGPNGAPGDKGQSGKSGEIGTALPICIKYGSTSFGDCQEFQSITGGKE